MKNTTQLIIILCLINFKTDLLFSQMQELEMIRITRISYVQKSFGTLQSQLKIDLNSNKVYFRKKCNRKFKEFQTKQDLSLLSDSTTISRIKEISKSTAVNDEECTFHNEYGYFKIELIQLNLQDEIYGEIFLINNPYECMNENDKVLVRAYYNLIIALLNEN